MTSLCLINDGLNPGLGMGQWLTLGKCQTTQEWYQGKHTAGLHCLDSWALSLDLSRIAAAAGNIGAVFITATSGITGDDVRSYSYGLITCRFYGGVSSNVHQISQEALAL